MNTACVRCGKVGEIKVTDERGSSIDDVEVDVEDGVLMYVCDECLTDAEQIAKTRQSVVAMLDTAEELIESMEMVFERVPGMRDDPESKQIYAEAQEQAAHARAMLAALESVDDE